jgi:phosphotransferase system HPr (HPr) family protein
MNIVARPADTATSMDYGLRMKLTTVIVPWKEGMLLCRAGNLARLASQFRSNILCRLDDKAAEAKSIISLLILCAGLGATLEIEASGPDEREAIRAVDRFFALGSESGMESNREALATVGGLS